MRQEAKQILDDLKIDIDPDQTVGDLPVSKQQMVEIAKALSINAKILIMDEPTSALTAKEIEDLFRIIRKLKSEGRGIVYISHRLEELAEIVDRVTIMRDGQYITNGNFSGYVYGSDYHKYGRTRDQREVPEGIVRKREKSIRG